MHVLQIPRQDIFSQQETEVTPPQEASLKAVITRREQREPLAYILGYKEFYGINLLVNPNVLIPRPETESLVEHTLFMALMGMESAELVIADIGTGTGAIAINLGIHIPAARIYAVDNYDSVLDVTSYNVRTHNVSDRVKLIKGDLLESLPEPVDVIVANLPYIPSQRIPNLQPEIQWEPSHALDGGEDGLDLIKRLMQQASQGHLKSHGVIILEVDPEQVSPIRHLAADLFPQSEFSIEKDLAQMDRMIVISLVSSDN
jgi:release factor glutamine methyltransferase